MRAARFVMQFRRARRTRRGTAVFALGEIGSEKAIAAPQKDRRGESRVRWYGGWRKKRLRAQDTTASFPLSETKRQLDAAQSKDRADR